MANPATEDRPYTVGEALGPSSGDPTFVTTHQAVDYALKESAKDLCGILAVWEGDRTLALIHEGALWRPA